jgi:hypothetical protein
MKHVALIGLRRTPIKAHVSGLPRFLQFRATPSTEVITIAPATAEHCHDVSEFFKPTGPRLWFPNDAGSIQQRYWLSPALGVADCYAIAGNHATQESLRELG